jgi:O-antigen/teichoic acid export membrane protein
LDELLIREVARDPGTARRYLANFGLARLSLGVLLYAVLAAIILGLTSYAPHTKHVILLLSISIIPEGLNRLAQAILTAQERFGDMAGISLLTSALGVCAGGAALWTGASLEIIVLTQVSVTLLGLLMYAALARFRYAVRLRGLRPDWRFLQRHIKPSLSFAYIELCIAVEWQIDVVLLSFFLSEEQVGFFSSAQTVVSAALFALSAYHSALYPLVARLYDTDRPRLWNLYRRLISYVGAASLIVSIAVATLSPIIIRTMYGPGFSPSAVVLQWLIWNAVINFWGEPNSRLVIVSGHQTPAAIFLFFGMAANILTNLVLIPRSGIVGAAWARVLSAAVFAVINGVFVYVRVSRINPLPIVARLLIAGLAMAGLILGLRAINVWLALFLGLCGFVLVSLAVHLVPVSDQRRLLQLVRSRIRTRIT